MPASGCPNAEPLLVSLIFAGRVSEFLGEFSQEGFYASLSCLLQTSLKTGIETEARSLGSVE